MVQLLDAKGTPSAMLWSPYLITLSGIRYDSFDILSDEAIRNELKEYVSWPTYPMLFVDGKLLGGLDIVQEVERAAAV
jgi:glutaredoxin-related protein